MIGKLRGAAAAALLSGITALLFAFGGATAARAQYVDPAAQHDFDLKVGVFLPYEQYARQHSGTEVLSLEGDMVIQKFPEKSFNALASVGLIERDGLRIIPVTVSQIYRDPGSPSAYNYYYGYGVGLYPTTLSGPDTDGKSKILWGGFVTAGIDLTSRTFVEAKYHYISKYDQKFVGGLILSVGERF